MSSGETSGKSSRAKKSWSNTPPRATLTPRPGTGDLGMYHLGEMPHTDAKLGMLKQMLETVPDIRQKKVRLLKQAIEGGRYQIDKAKLAKILVDQAAHDAVHRGKVGLRRWPPKD
jgi:flagellar biosynthesis anti-sigma factor FlgM